jgi:predicted aspartyl protease
MPDAHCGFDDIPGGATGSALLVVYGPTLLVDIGFDASFKLKGGNPPTPGMTGIRALVDTGATQSCIDSLLASQLNLPIVDKQHVGGVHGRLEVNMHLAQVHIPSLGFTIWGMFAGVHLAAGGQHHKALLGRTFLRNCSMTFNGTTGKVTISWPVAVK